MKSIHLHDALFRERRGNTAADSNELCTWRDHRHETTETKVTQIVARLVPFATQDTSCFVEL